MDSVREKIVNSNDKGNLLEALQEVCREKSIDIDDLVQLLARLHNEQSIDFLRAIDQMDKESSWGYYSIKSIFGKILPLLVVPVDRVLESIELLQDKTGNDLADTDLYEPLIEFCVLGEERYKALFDLIFQKIDCKSKHLNVALVAWSRVKLDEAIAESCRLLNNNQQTIKIGAISALGSFDYQGNEKTVADVFSKLEHTEINADIEKAALTRSLHRLLRLNSSLGRNLIRFLSENINEGDDQTLHQLSLILMNDTQRIHSTLLYTLLDKLKSVNCDNRSTINNLDYALSSIIKNDCLEVALEFIEALFIKNRPKIKIDMFDSFSRVIRESDKLLSYVMTRWFISKRIYFGRAAFELLALGGDGKNRHLTADLTLLDTSMQRIFVGRKACGWLYIYPVGAVSYILSLIDGAEAEAKQYLTALCFNPLLMSYPGSVKDYLEGVSKTDSDVAGSLLARLKDYHEGLSSSKDIKELEVPMSCRETYARKLSETMAKSYEKAQEGSLMSILGVKTTAILYGAGSIHYIERGGEAKSSRQETMMRPMSTSVEFPALESVDPHGLNQMVEYFRIEGCEA